MARERKRQGNNQHYQRIECLELSQLVKALEPNLASPAAAPMAMAAAPAAGAAASRR